MAKLFGFCRSHVTAMGASTTLTTIIGTFATDTPSIKFGTQTFVQPADDRARRHVTSCRGPFYMPSFMSIFKYHHPIAKCMEDENVDAAMQGQQRMVQQDYDPEWQYQCKVSTRRWEAYPPDIQRRLWEARTVLMSDG